MNTVDMDCEDSEPSTLDMEALSLSRESTLECAICLQPFVQPIKLPCSHTFCFLCAKGIALQRRPCALCRTDIPVNFLQTPGLFQADESKLKVDKFENGDRFVWFYQGHKGWWQYDDRTSVDLEKAFLQKEKSIDILIAGAIYIIDFESMVQYQRNLNSRKRKIKRDKITAEKKGVAGMAPDIPSSSIPPLPQPSQPVTRNSLQRQLPVGAAIDPNMGPLTGGNASGDDDSTN